MYFAISTNCSPFMHRVIHRTNLFHVEQEG